MGIEHSYAIGAVSATGLYVGGFVALVSNSNSSDNYCIDNDSNEGVTVLSEEEFGNQNNFIDFDFKNDWEMSIEATSPDFIRPHLQFEIINK